MFRQVIVLWPPVLAIALATSLAAQPANPAAPSSMPVDNSDSAEGLIRLDVVVTDQSGKAVAGLDAKDFSLVENGQPNEILSFHAFDGVSAKPDPPTVVILVIDTLELPPMLALLERKEAERFLRQNGGHLEQPVSVISLSDVGVRPVARASLDGNALADDIAHHWNVGLIREEEGNLTTRGQSLNTLSFKDPPSLSAVKTLSDIATTERRAPGRKLLIWIGPGWGIGSGADLREFPGNRKLRQALFDRISWFSTLLREARIALYSFSLGEDDPRSHLYLDYLGGVDSLAHANSVYLNRKVLAVESGGRVLEPESDLVKLINRCVQEANAFYTISFNPAPADHADEYHGLKVAMNKPELMARTNTGYYDQPFYSDPPDPQVKRVTAAQLEEVLSTAVGQGDSKIARQLSNLELTERLSDATLALWKEKLHGKKAREALVALADQSAFLDAPPELLSHEAPPDGGEQRRMISLAADYLNMTIARLPDFVATRTSVRYEEIPAFEKGDVSVAHQPLHVVESSRTTVLYRNGREVVDERVTRHDKKDRYLVTYGTFGPLLHAVIDALETPGDLTWSHWEQIAGGRRAIFRYVVPTEKSHFEAGGCCLPDGEGTSAFNRRTGFHWEVAIDPASGAIYRLDLKADVRAIPALDVSEIMVAYGPVEIGGKVYICPTRSVSIQRARSVTVLTAWEKGFRTWGPFATMLNDFTFSGYHVFGSSSRMLPDFTPMPVEK